MIEYDYFEKSPEEQKEARKQAALKAKQERLADPELIALQEEHKQHKKNAYLKAKKELKALALEDKENRRQAEEEKVERKRQQKIEDLKKLIKRASQLEQDKIK